MFARYLKALAFLLLCTAASEISFGQQPQYTVEVIPNNPTTQSPITIRIGIDRCFVSSTTVSFPNPNAIRIDLGSSVCPGTPFGNETVQVGVLAEGAYLVEVYHSGSLRGTAAFLVAAAPAGSVVPIPTMRIGLLAFAALMLVTVGALFLRKRGGGNGVRSIITIVCVSAVIAVTGHAGNSTAGEGPKADLSAGNYMPKRIQVRFNRALLDPTRDELQAAIDRPGTSTLAAILGRPKRIERIIGREPTPFEEYLVRKFPNTPEARLTRYFALDYSTAEWADTIRAQLAGDRRFEYVAQDPIVSPAAIPGELYVGASANPPGLGSGQYQWGLHALNFPAAFDKYTGSARIGVVDKGIGADPANPTLYHPDLRTNFRPHLSKNFARAADESAVMPLGATLDDNLWDEHYRRRRDAAGNVIGWWGPFAGHGTHVAGLIAANWNEGSTGVVGGCPDCSLVIGKIPGDSGTAVAAAISHLVDVGVQVINLSQEFRPATCEDLDFSALCDALAKARAADVAFVAASGNRQLNTLDNLFPVNQVGVIPVGGLEPGLTFWAGLPAGQPRLQWVQNAPGNAPANDLLLFDSTFGSNFGPSLRLVAPAAEVLSSFAPNNAWFIFRPRADGLQRWSGLDEPFTYQDPTLGNVTIATGPPPPSPPATSPGWGTMTGTSMAAPHVSAIAGLVRTVNPLRPATSIEELIATSTTRTTQHAGLAFAIPDARGAIDAALGNASAPNRRTPMFGL